MTNEQVKADIAANLPDNTSGLITPAKLRTEMGKMADYSDTAAAAAVAGHDSDPAAHGGATAGASLVVVPSTPSAGGPNYALNKDINSIDPATGTSIVCAPGQDGFPSTIGSKTAVPMHGTDAEWTADSAYEDGAASVAATFGGYDHVNNQLAGTIVGGGHNYIKYNLNGHSAIIGGSINLITAGRSVIVGSSLSIIRGMYKISSAIVGGYQNLVSSAYSGMIGGLENVISGDYSSAAGGQNTTVSGTHSASLAGQNITISGNHSASSGLRNTTSHNAALTTGQDALSLVDGSHTISSGKRVAQGDVQIVTAHCSARTTDDTVTNCYAVSGGGGAFINLPANSAVAGKIAVIGVREDTFVTAAFSLEFTAKWTGTTETIADAAGSGTTRNLAAISNPGGFEVPLLVLSEGSLRVKVVGFAATTVKWSVRWDLVTVAV